MRLGLRGALAVVAVARKIAARRPAVEEGRAVELQVVGHLRGAIEGVVEARVVAVHEHDGLILERAAAAHPLAHQRQELVRRQRFQLADGEVLLGVFRLLVDGDLQVGHPDRERPLDLRHLVRLGNGDERAPELQPVGTVRAVDDALGLVLAHAVGAIEHRHDVPFALGSGGRAGGRAATPGILLIRRFLGLGCARRTAWDHGAGLGWRWWRRRSDRGRCLGCLRRRLRLRAVLGGLRSPILRRPLLLNRRRRWRTGHLALQRHAA